MGGRSGWSAWHESLKPCRYGQLRSRIHAVPRLADRRHSPDGLLVERRRQHPHGKTIEFSSPPTTFTLTSGKILDRAPNLKSAETSIPLFNYPSDVTEAKVPGYSYGGTNYVANTGSGTLVFGTLTRADGVFYNGSSTSTSDFLDGTSHTVVFSERTLGPGSPANENSASDSKRSIWKIADASKPTPQACESKQSGTWYSDRGAKWIIGNYGNTLYNHYYRPNATTWDCMNITQRFGLMSARISHAGGVSILRCDGSVEFLSDEIDIQIWRALATRSGKDRIRHQ